MLGLVCFLLMNGWGQEAGPEHRATMRMQPPTMDGRLEEWFYSDANALTGFRLLGSQEPASAQTWVWVFYDPGHLYVAFRCEEPQMEGLQARILQRDGPVYEDDCVEVFLSPEPQRVPYYHFLVNAAGVQRDDEGQDPSWNAPWLARVHRGEDFWSVEMQIPLSALRVPPDAPEGFLWMQFARNRQPVKELSTWVPCKRSFHEPEHFGRVLCAGLDWMPYARRTFVEALAKARLRLEQVRQRAQRAWKAHLARQLLGQVAEEERLLREFDGAVRDAVLLGSLSRAWGLFRRWEALLLDHEREASRALLIHQAKGLPQEPDPPLVVCAESPMTKLSPDLPYQGHPVEEVETFVARREAEGVQLVLVPTLGSVEGDLLVTPPMHVVTNSPLPRESLRVERLDTVRIVRSSGGAPLPPGRWPDPLIPTHRFRIPQGELQSFLLTVRVPPEAPAGDYLSRIYARLEGGEQVALRWRIHVWDFTLPLRPTLRTCFLLSWGHLQKRHALEGDWVWTTDEEGYRPVPDNAVRSGEAAFEGGFSLRALPSASRYVHLNSPWSLKREPGEDVEVSFACRSDEGGRLFVMFTGVNPPPNPNRFWTGLPPLEPGRWYVARCRLSEAGVPEGASCGLQFVHDNGGSRQPHGFYLDAVRVERLRADGRREVLGEEGFEKSPEERRTLGRLVRAYHLDMLEHRVSPAFIAAPEIRVHPDGKVEMDWRRFDEEVAFYLRHGLTGFNITWLRIGSGWGEAWTPEEEAARRVAAQIIAQTNAHLEERGWADLGYIYVFDEPGAKAFEPIRRAFQFVREHGPSLRRLLTFGYGATRPWRPGAKEGAPAYAALADVVDLAVPHSDCFEPATMNLWRREGKEVWLYVCISAQRPYANIWGIDYPGTDHRIVFWQLWRYGVQGFLYWNVSYWQENPWENPMTYPGGNGDGSLLYPGEEGPIHSLRWEILRDGIEDFDFLSLLEANLLRARRSGVEPTLLREAEALLDVSPVCRSFTEYTEDPAVIEAHRRRVGEMLERLVRAMGGGGGM